MLMKYSFFSSFLALIINFPFKLDLIFVPIILHGLGLDQRQRFGHFCLLYPLSLSRASLYALCCIFFTKDLWNQVSWIGTCVHHWQIGTIIRIRGCRHRITIRIAIKLYNLFLCHFDVYPKSMGPMATGSLNPSEGRQSASHKSFRVWGPALDVRVKLLRNGQNKQQETITNDHFHLSITLVISVFTAPGFISWITTPVPSTSSARDWEIYGKDILLIGKRFYFEKSS